MPVGFTQAPGGPSYKNRSVLAYHVYCTASPDKPSAIVELDCAAQDRLLIDLRQHDQARLGVGGFLSEFGAIGVNNGSIEEIDRVASLAEQHLQSWTYWKYKFNDEPMMEPHTYDLPLYDARTGQVEQQKLRVLSRTYAPITAGTPLKMDFDYRSGAFLFEYRTNHLSTHSQTEVRR